MKRNLDIIRSAAFQAQSERLDFRTKGVKKCNPPNRRCGDRCIPPNWDCRLRGEGNDPHLRAAGKGSDPIGGFANIERGFQRFGRAVTKFSFSELEGSRRAFARGSAKLHPGDLKEKEKAKERVFQLATWVGTPALAVIFAGLAHTGLKANRGYREGFGRQVDTAVSDTMFNIRRNLPIVSGPIRAREAASSTALQSLRTSNLRRAIGAPSSIASTAGNSFLAATTRRQALGASRGETSGVDAIRRNLQTVDRSLNDPGQPSRLSYSEWLPKSLKSYWSTKLPTALHGSITGDGTTSLFAVASTNNLLRRSYGFGPDISTGADLKADASLIVKSMTSRLQDSRQALLADMKQRGLDPAVDMDRYLDMRAADWRTGQEALDVETHSAIKRLLQTSDTYTFAREQYKTTRDAFTSYFDNISVDMTSPPDIRNPMMSSASRRRSPYADGVLGHAEGLARFTNLGWPSNRPIRTPEMAELVRRAYHARIVMGQSNPTVAFSSVGRLKAVALELSGRSGVISTQEATEIVARFLQPMGFSGVTVARGRRDHYDESFQETFLRLDKRCGKSGIPDDRKCHVPTYGAATAGAAGGRTATAKAPTSKRTAPRPQPAKPATAPKPAAAPSRAAKPAATAPKQPPKEKPKEEQNNTVRNVALGIAGVGAGVLLGKAGFQAAQIQQYRKNVSKSAIEAEKLSFEFERTFREQAARRLGKRPEEVTGLEASMYNFKDRGKDLGLNDFDRSPSWYGQTKNSAGAVVLLSYSDDGDFTRRGTGSLKMAEGGVWNHILGNRDVLPFANNISQPYVKPKDELQKLQRKGTVEKIAGVGETLGRATGTVTGALGGPSADQLATKGRDLAKGAGSFATELPETFERFEFLRKNVERGHNPDAIRTAAFVVAQRRLTGKPVDIMSYSNGGNVATETLAILDQMGYRDVKVVNIAGPTFGIFSHDRDHMRTWVSSGDEFMQYTRGAAYTGGNTKILQNSDKIPHGLMDRIDPNNELAGGTAEQNRRNRESYMLNEELAYDAYKFLHVNHERSAELERELIYKLASGKEIDGDLRNLFGDETDSKMEFFKGMLSDDRNRERNKQAIRDEIEDKMLEKWYGGYKASKARNEQKKLRAEIQEQAEMQEFGYSSAAEAKAINKMLQQKKPDGSPRYASREAAELAYRRERNAMDSQDPYLTAYRATLAKLSACNSSKTTTSVCAA